MKNNNYLISLCFYFFILNNLNSAALYFWVCEISVQIQKRSRNISLLKDEKM